MFGKIFRKLTQSDEARYLEEFETFAKSIQDQGAPHLATLARKFATLKHDIDQRIANRDKAMLDVDDFDKLAIVVCDGAKEKIRQLSKLAAELPDVITAGSAKRVADHMEKWQADNALLARAYATLRHAATGESPAGIETLESTEQNEMTSALDSLDLQVRTAMRIRSELG